MSEADEAMKEFEDFINKSAPIRPGGEWSASKQELSDLTWWQSELLLLLRVMPSLAAVLIIALLFSFFLIVVGLLVCIFLFIESLF